MTGLIMPRYSDVKSIAQDQHIPFIFDNILLVFKVNLYVNRKKLNINMCVYCVMHWGNF